MLAVPLAAGTVLGGARPAHALLAAAWFAAYLFFADAQGWLRARRRPQARARHLRPLLVYGAVAATAGAALAATAPRVLAWAPAFAVLGAASCFLVAHGRVRSALNDALGVLAACLLTPLAAGLGPAGAATAGIPLPCAPPTAWAAGAVIAGYFLGTVPYVKTMIRERGSAPWYAGSVAYHLLGAAAAGIAAGPLLGTLGALLAARAAIVPKVWPRAKPLAVGLGEFAASAGVLAAVIVRF
jgi:hypothetical protein